jgi:hypothetical protein
MLIPISLYVSVEFVKAFIAQIISSDRLMYVEEEDMPSKARSAGLCEELGQVLKSLYSMRTCFFFIRSHPALKITSFSRSTTSFRTKQGR